MDIKQEETPPEFATRTASWHKSFLLTQDDFVRVQRLIYEHAGIVLSDIKFDMVYSRLIRRVRSGKHHSFCEYLDWLEQLDDSTAWEGFINALTTNMTSFFREAHHFPILAAHLRKQTHRPLHIWCCAASTGEEAYSIAMTVAEVFGSTNVPVNILASDIDTHVLAVAEKGIYPAERIENLSNEQRQRFFLRGKGRHEGMVAIRPEIRHMVKFAQINLLAPEWPISVPIDVIFCRNVMIYFDKKTQYNILSRFVPLLHPEALLFAGHSESFFHASDIFRSIGRTVYVLNTRTDDNDQTV